MIVPVYLPYYVLTGAIGTIAAILFGLRSATCGGRLCGSAQRFLSVHAATQNTFNVQRHLTSARTHRAFRASALRTRHEVVAAA
jgi:hypothetical protein